MFNERLKGLRSEVGLTQDEVAEKLNVGRSTYASWEIGRSEPSISNLIDLAEFYNVSMDYLCGTTLLRENYKLDCRLEKYISECITLYSKYFKDQL